MNIFIVTAGSRGDVQPYIALGKGLQHAGNDVTLCTCSSFESFITGYGLRYGYMNDDFIRLVDSEAGRDVIESSGNFFGLVKTMLSLMKDAKRLNREMMKDAWHAAAEAQPDIIIFHPKVLAGPHIAEKLGVPAVMAVPAPVIVPTSEFPAIGFPKLKLGRWYNRLSYVVLHKGYHNYDDVVNEFRQDILGLEKYPKSIPPIQKADGTPIPILHGYSKYVWPVPEDWPETARITGYWFLEEAGDWQPPADLQAFLAAGEPPVYVGFGSMAGRNPQKTTEMVIEALVMAGVRGIIATGWGGLDVDVLPQTIFKINEAPHSWLFPHVSAVIHHGGAGTTAAGLRSGRPAVICPFVIDQYDWGERLYQLGVACKPIPHKQLTAGRLAKAITEVTKNVEMRRNAENLGDRIRREDGIATVLEMIQYF